MLSHLEIFVSPLLPPAQLGRPGSLYKTTADYMWSYKRDSRNFIFVPCGLGERQTPLVLLSRFTSPRELRSQDLETVEVRLTAIAVVVPTVVVIVVIAVVVIVAIVVILGINITLDVELKCIMGTFRFKLIIAVCIVVSRAVAFARDFTRGRGRLGYDAREAALNLLQGVVR